MRKITKDIVGAFLAGKVKKSGNTSTDGKSLFLFDNEIAKVKNGELYVTTAGWDTPTTKERLNALPNVRVSTKNYRLYLNGKEWNGGWISVGPIYGIGMGAAKNKKKKPDIYYKTYSEAIDDVYRYLSDEYNIDGDDWFNQLNLGGKPKLHQTKRAIITLYSPTTGKPLKKALAVQVYRLSENTFELNWYVA